MFISWMLIMPSFRKSLIVEQFQGNYLKTMFTNSSRGHSRCYMYYMYQRECPRKDLLNIDFYIWGKFALKQTKVIDFLTIFSAVTPVD